MSACHERGGLEGLKQMGGEEPRISRMSRIGMRGGSCRWVGECRGMGVWGYRSGELGSVSGYGSIRVSEWGAYRRGAFEVPHSETIGKNSNHFPEDPHLRNSRGIPLHPTLPYSDIDVRIRPIPQRCLPAIPTTAGVSG